jgi:hypothetical protein
MATVFQTGGIAGGFTSSSMVERRLWLTDTAGDGAGIARFSAVVY